VLDCADEIEGGTRVTLDVIADVTCIVTFVPIRVVGVEEYIEVSVSESV
jgi:hypothetical protein